MMTIAKSATRLLAFIGRELVETTRRPGALLSLVLGPFLVMAIFGLGYSGFKRPLQTILVVPPESGLPTDVATYQEMASTGLEITAVVPDRASAEAPLRAQQVDVVVVAPADLEARFRAGQQTPLEVIVDTVDPVAANYATFLAGILADHVNKELIRRAVEEGQAQAAQEGVPDASAIPPEVVAEPTTASMANIAPIQPTVVSFFGPAVLALILQHMAVTLIALSVVRERTTGIIDVFRISPTSAWEVVLGKVLGFGVLCMGLAGLTVALLVGALGVPLLGQPIELIGVIALLIFASLGLGLLISIVSDSERQAVQLSLLVLLASVFFSGFVLPIEEFTDAVRTGAYLLPVTHGIRLTQDVMLRGWTNDGWEIGALAAIGLVLLVACWLLLRRRMTRA